MDQRVKTWGMYADAIGYCRLETFARKTYYEDLTVSESRGRDGVPMTASGIAKIGLLLVDLIANAAGVNAEAARKELALRIISTDTSAEKLLEDIKKELPE
jgi:hypothetical protein